MDLFVQEFSRLLPTPSWSWTQPTGLAGVAGERQEQAAPAPGGLGGPGRQLPCLDAAGQPTTGGARWLALDVLLRPGVINLVVVCGTQTR